VSDQRKHTIFGVAFQLKGNEQLQTNSIDPAQLTHDLGGSWYRAYGTAPCPCCQPERRIDQRALTINAKGERLLLHCKKSGCDFKDILIAAGIQPGHFEIDALALENARQERLAHQAKMLARARSIWGNTTSIAGSKGKAYYRSRGITCSLPETLRWAPDVFHAPSGTYCSAIVADVSTGGVHRTFFTKQGERLASNAKMMLGPCARGAVRLSESTGPLVVCEGIETSLSLLSGLLSGPHTVWAALSTSGIKSLELPKAPGELVLAPDGDEAGRGAASALGMRAHALGWKVSTIDPGDGLDWNDVLTSEVAA